MSLRNAILTAGYVIALGLHPAAAGAAAGATSVARAGEVSHPPEIVIRWAPEILHAVDPLLDHEGRADRLTRFDFDGDWSATNNQANFESEMYPLPGAVYYGVIETRTHWYLTYAFFHPLDVSLSKPGLCVAHENDMEGVTLVVRKDGSAQGEARVLSSEAHGRVYAFSPSGSDVWLGRNHVDRDSLGVPDTTLFVGSRGPLVFVEPGGHGVGGRHQALTPNSGGRFDLDGTTYDFATGEGWVYYHDGGPGEDPAAVAGAEVRYDLLPLTDLWSRRSADEDTYCEYEDYLGARGCALGGLAVSFRGTCWPSGSCAANPPWGWDSDHPGMARGDWFLDPAHVTGTVHLADFPDRHMEGFGDYVSNPYLQGDLVLELAVPTTKRAWRVGDVVSIGWQYEDGVQGPDLTSAVTAELSRNGGGWEFMGSAPAVREELSWAVSAPAASSCRIRIRAETDCILTLVDVVGGVGIEADTGDYPAEESRPALLDTVFPNPSRLGSLQCRFRLREAGPARVRVYDVGGRLIRTLLDTSEHPAGWGAVLWDGRDELGRDTGAGVYRIRLEHAGYSADQNAVRLP